MAGLVTKNIIIPTIENIAKNVTLQVSYHINTRSRAWPLNQVDNEWAPHVQYRQISNQLIKGAYRGVYFKPVPQLFYPTPYTLIYIPSFYALAYLDYIGFLWSSWPTGAEFTAICTSLCAGFLWYAELSASVGAMHLFDLNYVRLTCMVNYLDCYLVNYRSVACWLECHAYTYGANPLFKEFWRVQYDLNSVLKELQATQCRLSLHRELLGRPIPSVPTFNPARLNLLNIDSQFMCHCILSATCFSFGLLSCFLFSVDGGYIISIK